MPKLLLLRQIRGCLPGLRIILPRALPGWVTNWIQFVLPGAELDIYDERTEYLQCEALLMPTLLMHPEHFLHPTLGTLLDELVHETAGEVVKRQNIYVSRVAPSWFRKLSNQVDVEEIAVQEGLTLLKPETLSLAEQIKAFASADVIVGEFGSAMHNALFSSPQTKVFCLNWINGMQSRIAQLRRHRVGYLLPSDGPPIKYVAGSAQTSYCIDSALFRRCLRALTYAHE